MEKKNYTIETRKPFSESLIWQMNRDYYEDIGINAWKNGPVPHHLTSNSRVGKTYADLIFAFLKDLANKGQTKETVYILELGAGHGRLAFHILKHLERLMEQLGLDLPPYCYVISDIIEENLAFFQAQKQFQPFVDKGQLEVAYFDAIDTKELLLRHSGKKILPNELEQPILAIANYFFDSLPRDLFHLENTKVAACWVAIESKVDPKDMEAVELIDNLKLVYSTIPVKMPYYDQVILNEILEAYRLSLFGTYLIFPKKSLQCIEHLRQISKKGLMIISMDKGFHEIHDLENAKTPDWVTHGSFSFPVNYHAFGQYCEKHGGTVFFPTFSTFDLELGCFLFLEDSTSYTETKSAYIRCVDDLGPDDYFGLNQFNHKHVASMNLRELIGMLRLGGYDSTLFKKVLPRLKQVYGRISYNERTRLSQTLHQTWNMYYSLNEKQDLAFEIGGIFYALGYYQDALDYFQLSIDSYGHTADGFYNRVLCYYQLRQDVLFKKTLDAAESSFPGFKQFEELRRLDMGAA